MRGLPWLRDAIATVALPRLLPTACGVMSVATTTPLLALTFDDGPHPDSTPAFLDLLREHDVRATFFPLGVRAQRHPEIVDRIRNEGHAIGVHGWAHGSLTRDVSRWPVSAWRMRRAEALRARAAICPTDPIYRTAYGHHNPAVVLALRSAGFRVIQWSAGVDDWTSATPSELAHAVLSSVHPGGIVLWHDAASDVHAESALDRSASLAALTLALPDLRSRFHLVTVPELLAAGAPVLRAGGSSRRSPGPGQFLASDLAGAK